MCSKIKRYARHGTLSTEIVYMHMYSTSERRAAKQKKNKCTKVNGHCPARRVPYILYIARKCRIHTTPAPPATATPTTTTKHHHSNWARNKAMAWYSLIFLYIPETNAVESFHCVTLWASTLLDIVDVRCLTLDAVE